MLDVGITFGFLPFTNSMDILSLVAGSQYQCVDGDVPGLEILTIFDQNGEGYFSPSCVLPLGSDQERDHVFALRWQGFYRKIQVTGIVSFKIMDG